ncbi:HNH endonuclease [Candidatus Uhrbacteria bacterium]|nr:HNH endonuclease [Candidatus Uhrbacteria bacterium]
MFYIKPSHKKLGEGKYCSRVCSDIGRKKGKTVHCAKCRKGFYAPPKQLRSSKSKLNFCRRECYLKYQVGKYHPLWKGGESIYLSLMRKKRKQICRKCGIYDPHVLIVHHIDKNRKNNVLSNLVWLCRNCHFLVHKYSETW